MRRAWSVLIPSLSLTAAGSPLVEPNTSPGEPARPYPQVAGGQSRAAVPDSIRARHQEWQLKSLLYMEAVPELAGASALVRDTMSSVKWNVTGGNAATRARIQARVDAFDKDRACELVWGSGETYVAVPEDRGQPIDQLEAPYTLSVAEFKPRRDPTSLDKMMGPNMEWVDLVEEGTDAPVPYMRIWRPSKRNRWHAYSPTKAVADVLEAMYVAQLVDTATQKSRLMYAGIVFWPTNKPSVPVAPGEAPAPGSQQEMLKAFSDAANAVDLLHSEGKDATKPFVVMYDPGKGAEATKYHPEMFRIEREDLASQRALRVDVDKARLADALELPAEAMTGMKGANRFSVHQIDSDKWKTYFKPLDDLVRTWFEKRVVKAYGSEYSLVADATELIARTDETDTAIKLMTIQQVTPESGVAAVQAKDVGLLVAQTPPLKLTDTSGSTAPDQPSDFGTGNTDRGGGTFREQTPTNNGVTT